MPGFTFAASGTLPDPPWKEIRSGLTQLLGTVVNTVSGLGQVFWDGAIFTANQFIETIWANDNSTIFDGNSLQYLLGSDVSNYLSVNYDDGRHNVVISGLVGGSSLGTLMTVAVPTPFAAGANLRFEVVGGITGLYYNGVPYGTPTNVAGLSIPLGNPGLGLSGNAGSNGAWGSGSLGDVSAGHARIGADCVSNGFGKIMSFGANGKRC